MKRSKSKIVTDFFELQKPVPITKFEPKEVEVLSAALFTELANHSGLGLSANQIGIDKRICVINVKEPIILVNPRIVAASDNQYTYYESCLSIPKTLQKPIKTTRFGEITVEADNYEGQLTFGPDDESDWEADAMSFWNDRGFLECVVVQHEIDHLDGITIRDRNYNVPVHTTKFERNKRYMFRSPDGDMEFLKYKKGERLVNDGWEVVS